MEYRSSFQENWIDYRRFLERDLPMLLEEVTLLLVGEIWYTHDGAPKHFNILPRKFLNKAFTNRWIGCRETQSWSPWSPDLNSLD